MKGKAKLKGFTLVELMIVVAVVAILVALALPSYTRYVHKANRGEAQSTLLNWANNQEIWRANHATYTDGTLQEDGTQLLKPANTTKYKFFIAAGATTYTLTAIPQDDQANDEDRGVKCNPLTLDQSNAKTPAECW